MNRAVLALLFLAACSGETAKTRGVTVVAFAPEGLVEPTRAIEVKLSEPVVAEEEVGKTTGDVLLSIDPPIEGELRWIARDTLRLAPHAPFRESTRYRVKVLVDVPSVHTFHTRMFGVASVESLEEGRRVNVELTHAVTPAAAQAAISFSDGSGVPVAAELVSKEAGRVMVFSPAPVAGDELSVRIDGALAPQAGGQSIGKAVVRSLRPREDASLRIESIAPVQLGTELALQVRFSSNVDAEALEPQISVSPPVELRIEEGYHTATLHGAFTPGDKVSVTVKKGLTSRAGHALEEDASEPVDLPALEPAVRFPDRSSAVETVNVERLAVEVIEIFENNLVHVLARPRSVPLPGSMGARVLETEIQVRGKSNEPVRTALPFDDLSTSKRRGLHLISVRDADRPWIRAEHWAMADDLGVTAKIGTDEIRVQVISLATLDPIGGAKIELLSATNAPLAEAVTDARGVAVVKATFDEPVSLVIARSDGEVAYLPIAGTALSAAGYDAFAYTDRGAYRPGETMHLTAVIRDRALTTPPPITFSVELLDPSGRTVLVHDGVTNAGGARSFSIPIPRGATAGAWSARVVRAGELLGEAFFSVEGREHPIRDRTSVETEPPEIVAGEARTRPAPDRVMMSLDRTAYDVGGVAQVRVQAPFSGGRLLLTVERDRVLWSGSLELETDTATVQVPVSAAMSPNAYLVAQQVRRPSAAEPGAPVRAFGMVPLEVNDERHALEVKMEAPAEMRPGSKLQVHLRGMRSSGASHFTVAAVDEALLADGFAPPDPFAFFTRRRPLGLRTHDSFGPAPFDLRAEETARRPPVHARLLDPIDASRRKPVALWSGLVSAGPDGSATIELDLPPFSGTLRVMAVGFAGDRFGSATAQVRVTDPVAVLPILPRFAATLDRFEMPVKVLNTTGAALQARLTVTAKGGLAVTGSSEAPVSIEAGGGATASFELRAGELPGDAEVSVRVQSSAGESTVTVKLPIRSSGHELARVERRIASYNRPAVFELPGGLSGSLDARIEIGASPAFHFGEALERLLRGPHRNVEAATSRAFPLLVLPELAEVVASDLDGGREQLIARGISRVLSAMLPDGGLAHWPGERWGYVWTTVYGAHFLVEAKRAGFAVEARALDELLLHLGSIGAGTSVGSQRGGIDFRTRAYALYVLALAGWKNAAALEELAARFERALLEEERAVPTDNEIRALIAGGLAHSGRAERARELLGEDLVATSSSLRRGFFSSTRADALALSILADIRPAHPSIPTLLDVLSNRADGGRWSTTQENAFALLALGKLNRKTEGRRPFWGSVHVGGEVAKRFAGTEPFLLEDEGGAWRGKKIEVTVTGAGKAYVAFRVRGIESGAATPSSSGIELERRYLQADGSPITDGGVDLGAEVITELLVRAPEGVPLSNVAIVDSLPAGLELEGLKPATLADHVDVHEDRIAFYADLHAGEARTFSYVSRAVTRGSFALPHARAEAIYDPAVHASAGGGRFEVR